ncbi:MAG: hypothetical protein FWD28_08000 [Treponema sp.]|nr:hypothetical protein [Treponema sp.]
MKRILAITALLCLPYLSIFAETFTFRQMDTVTITPPQGWEIWAVENTDRRGNHQITFYADESRKPGATISIMAGNRPAVYTEASFLAQINEWYLEYADQFVEKSPSFKRIDINNGIAYYFVVQYAEYAGLPPAEGRAKVGGLLFIYQEGNPIAAASLYVDDPLDPALDIMVKAVCSIQMSFPEYTSNIYRFDTRNAVKLDIPQAWRVRISREIPESGVSYTLEINPGNNARFLALITIIAPNPPNNLTREQLHARLLDDADNFISQAVEEQADIILVNVRNGFGGYFTLTDIELVGRTPRRDEYLLFTRFYIQYNNGVLAYVTALMDDVKSIEYQQFVDALLTMEPIR